MSQLFSLLVCTALVSLICATLVIRHAEKLRLVQVPNYRSSHVRPTPVGGGLGVVIAGTLAGMFLMTRSGTLAGWAMLVLALPIAAAGLLDDIKNLSARTRFALQLLLTGGFLAILGTMPEVRLSPNLSLHGPALMLLLLLAGVWWINLFNFMDGIDGIAGSQAVFMLLAGAGLAAWGRPDVTADPIWILMLCMAAAAIGFLCLNWPPARIFMGDVGSTYLAFIISALALATVQAGWLSYPVWLVLGAMFVSDATVTLLTRMIRHERWHAPHRSHAYQRLARHYGKSGHTHLPVTLLTIGINILGLAPLAWACLAWPQWAWGFVVLAYAPLLAAVIALGAGKPDDH